MMYVNNKIKNKVRILNVLAVIIDQYVDRR